MKTAKKQVLYRNILITEFLSICIQTPTQSLSHEEE